MPSTDKILPPMTETRRTLEEDTGFEMRKMDDKTLLSFFPSECFLFEGKTLQYSLAHYLDLQQHAKKKQPKKQSSLKIWMSANDGFISSKIYEECI